MSVETWSDNIIVVELQADPGFSDDMTALFERLDVNTNTDVVVSFAGVNYLNSSNIAKLLKLRKKVLTNRRRLVLCQINTNVWGLFLVTGLDKVFGFAESVATALATVQLNAQEEPTTGSPGSSAD
ncbi:MAG: STAS domain-containing protein [Planctomycetota bacterium]